jgi:hypothetical protein
MTRCLHALLGLLGLFCVPATAVAQISAPSPQSASVIATGTSRSRPLADHLGDTIRAVNFGTCTWDSGHDVAPCIQSAINAAVAARGGDVIVPVGSYELASTLTISTDLVRLVSAGGSDGLSWDDLSHQGTFPTVLTWTGNAGAAMLTIAPPSNTISGQPLRGTGIKGILFNANSIAGYGAQLMSVRAGEFRFGFRDAVMAGVLLDTVPLGEANDVQDNTFSIRGTNGDTDGDGIRFQATGNGGAENGNISLNIFDYATLRVRNGWCFNYTSASPNQSADNNYFRLAQCQQVGNTSGAGGGIHFVGGSQQVFGYYNGAPVVQETGTGGNIFLMLDTGNGTQTPTINGGTPISWTDSTGTTHNEALAGQTIISDNTGQFTAMQTARVYSTNATLQIVNASDNQLRLWNSGFTDGWTITTDTSTGNLRFVRLAGSGAINLGNGAPVLAQSFIKNTGTPYSFGGAGDLLSGNPYGNAFQVLGTPFTQSGAAENPNLSIYSAIDNATNPTTRQMVIDAEGTSGAGAMDLALRNSTGGWIRFQNAGGQQTGYISNTGTIGGTALAVTGTASAASLLLSPTTPASSSAACTAGQISVDANYVYVCTATNTWKRAALSSW